MQPATPAPITPGSDVGGSAAIAEQAAAVAAAAALPLVASDDELLRFEPNTSFFEDHEQRTLLSGSVLASMAPAAQENLHAIDTVRRHPAG